MTFIHHQSAHCESGVMSSLLTNAGFAISEPMVFGLSSALAFAYLPIVKLNGMPLIAYRMPPKHIINTLNKRLGLAIQSQRFGSAEAGQQALDQALAKQQAVGLQTSVFWLPYFPSEMRFHFNAHNLLVYGKAQDNYLISDPVFEDVVQCDAAALTKARFARGALAPKGLMYTLGKTPAEPNWPQLIRQSIKATSRILDGLPLPWIGVRGILHLANKIAKLDPAAVKYNRLYLTHIVRMQEEIGTGGAGFRFMYASFLQEAADKLNEPLLHTAANDMTAIGDGWRGFASQLVQYCKARQTNTDFAPLAASLRTLAAQERQLMQQLAIWSKTRS
ncbi:MAG: BtrH N-terminal domain-containing protein [Gammaproteobacteria bacterium]|nr:BtrH N-terminal domain-containing protein [Gammaproteobacteria bacterium]MBU1553593.1 BtrH N-terminal domain-containing protein [Gammaproteobacteria bacterium]MBU2070583.1 BtrH N-terminal domain-containing protein [Gammaproteobacteria bacterium]MBU2181995.1 BtrH N-terminal domain-containing protein [Gammaproteobacteria bacterium]MBU2207089.1 BtrH N-terminal domain-containing protein [Gammaproteobacteria bacterium]